MSSTNATSDVPMPRSPAVVHSGSGGRWLLGFAVAGLVLSILYALSIGPAMQLNKRGVISAETLERTYLPLMLASDFPASKWFLEHYIALWVPPEPALR